MTVSRPFAALKQLVRSRPPAETCEVCGVGLAEEHQHLVEPATRKLLCSCQACALLFSGGQSERFRLVPKGSRLLREFQLSDAQWEGLLVPISLAFFFHNSQAGRVVAFYPSPAGPTESLLTLEAWQSIVEENPVLRELQPDVEALLVNRVGSARDHYRVPIDECYTLVGLIRAHWRGLSGGTEVWKHVSRFFERLGRPSDA